MARLPRLYAPRVPQLVQARFAFRLAAPDAPAPASALDRILDWLTQETRRRPLAVHAWIVLPDRITLLATPGNAQALPGLMQSLGRRMGSGLMRTRVFASRYHNALLEPGRWILPAMVWLESLPVTTGQVSHAAQWPWSSAAGHLGLTADAVLTDHSDYWHEGDTPFARQAAWRSRLAAGLNELQRAQIDAALAGQWALGEKIFLAHLGRLASRRVSPAPRGRPRKHPQAKP